MGGPGLGSGEAKGTERKRFSAPEPISGPPPGPAEADLVARAREGDQEAFRLLVDRHTGRIFSLCRRLLGPRRHLAEDMTQEVFLRAWRGLPAYSPGGLFSTWLHRIALNFWIQEHRRATARKRSGPTLSLDAPLRHPDSDLFLQPPSRELAPPHLAAAGEMGQAILAALDTLEGEMREILVLRDLEGHSYEEIASLLEVPVGTVRSRLHRARARLQPLLARFLEP